VGRPKTQGDDAQRIAVRLPRELWDLVQGYVERRVSKDSLYSMSQFLREAIQTKLTGEPVAKKRKP